MGKKDKKEKKDLDKKSKKKKESKKIKNTDDVSDDVKFSMPKPKFYNAPDMVNLPPSIRRIVNHIQRDSGVQFNTVNVRMVGLDEIDDLPIDLLKHILKNAVSDECYELASIVRDAIKNKKDGE